MEGLERGQEGAGGDKLGLRVVDVEMPHSPKGSPEWVWVQLTWFYQLGHQQVRLSKQTGRQGPTHL